LGNILGARIIAITCTDDKCKWLELGVDKALNYKSPTFVNDFKESVGYLDVYIDNSRRLPYFLVCTHGEFRFVGDEILELCLTRLKKYARIVICGMSYLSIVKTCADNHHKGDFEFRFRHQDDHVNANSRLTLISPTPRGLKG
jgi:hypothetical protein